MGKIKNVVFDMGGVLIDLDKDACIRAFKQIGYKDIDSVLDSYSQKGAFKLLENNSVSTAEFHDMIRKELTEYASDQQIDYALNQFLIGLPVEKLVMLRELRKRFKVYMLSNTNQIAIDFIDQTMFSQEGLTADAYFDHRYLSYKMKMLKPDEDIFLAMVEHGKMKPEETLFLDDSVANIATADRLGFATHLVKAGEDYTHIFETI